MGRLVVVSNRVAVPEKNTSARAGGLAIAVNAALKQKSGIWFGWSGKIATQSKISTQKVINNKITYITLDLSKEDHREYYSGFANRVLWPILHYRIDLAEFSRRDLSGYMRVNDNFARELHKVIEPEDLVWVHDYHLMPLAKALRERGHRNRIGFFLHIPCPPPEMLTALPNHERLIPSVCEYDLVGFQTGDDAFNFSRYLTRECGLHSRDFNFVVADRTVRIGAFPVGIDAAAFAYLAQNSMRLPFVKRVIKSLGDRSLIIGVDRLDYSKGIAQRLTAFERFLQTQPHWRGKVTYLQIAPKSRTEIPEYADIELGIGLAAGRINGAYGEADWTPIRYINRAYSHSTLAGLYRAARVGLRDSAAGRYEPRRQGICGLAESRRPGCSYPIALRWRRSGMQSGAADQSLRPRQRRGSHRSGAFDVIVRAARAARLDVPDTLTQRYPTLGPQLPHRAGTRAWRPKSARTNNPSGIVTLSANPIANRISLSCLLRNVSRRGPSGRHSIQADEESWRLRSRAEGHPAAWIWKP